MSDGTKAVDAAEIRRRVTRTIADAKAAAVVRREHAIVADAAGLDALARIVKPIARTIAATLTAEGYRCSVETPVGAVRLSFESSQDDYVEVALETTSDPPALVGRTGRGRGSHVIRNEQVIAAHPAITELAEEALLSFFLCEISPFVER